MKKLIKYIKKYPFDATIWGILLVGLMVVLYFVYIIFISDDLGDRYGTRLEIVKNVEVNKPVIIEEINKNELVSTARVSVSGAIVNIEIRTKDKLTKKNIDQISSQTLSIINESVKNYYDIQLFLVSDGFPEDESKAVVGYVRAGTNSVAWTYNKGALS